MCLFFLLDGSSMGMIVSMGIDHGYHGIDESLNSHFESVKWHQFFSNIY